MTQGKQYARPPIDEAVVEFLFASSSEWDGTLPGRLQAALAPLYAGPARQQELFTLTARPGTQPSFATQATTRTLLPTVDGKCVVGVSPNLVTVHQLAPYHGWDDFSARVSEGLRAYWRVATPNGVQRLRIRYINRIVIPTTEINLELYFTAAPRLPEGMRGALRNFISRVELPQEDGSVLIMTFAPVPSEEQKCAFLLDFDLVLAFETPVDTDAALAALETLRTRERAAFEAMITDETRRLFE